MKLIFKTPISLEVEVVKNAFNRDLFIHLSKGLMPFDLQRFDGCKVGDEIHIKLGVGLFSTKWVSLITFEETNASGWSFVDEGKVLPWPLNYWKHHHRVDRISDTESEIVDDIEFTCSPKFLTPIMRPFLWKMFSMRPHRYQIFFKE